jgi:ABC-type branched-subunit amino acid transport system ATPase component
LRTPLILCFKLRVRNADSIQSANRAGTTILLVEQNARMALLIAIRAFVLETGRVMLSDTATNLLANEEMKAHYLGAHNHIKEARQRRLDERAHA